MVLADLADLAPHRSGLDQRPADQDAADQQNEDDEDHR